MKMANLFLKNIDVKCVGNGKRLTPTSIAPQDVRHMKGLPVRGQRTKSNFRKNKGKGSLGVKRKEGSKAGKV